MSMDKPKITMGKHTYRVSFLAVREKIDEFLSEGYSWKAIYDFFIKTSVFSMSYSTFCRYMNGINKPVKKRVETAVQEVKKNTVETTYEPKKTKVPVIIQQPKEDAFTDKSQPDKDTLV